MFTPNQDEMVNLMKTVMSIKGVTGSNPTHGRISIPAAERLFPDTRRVSMNVRISENINKINSSPQAL